MGSRRPSVVCFILLTLVRSKRINDVGSAAHALHLPGASTNSIDAYMPALVTASASKIQNRVCIGEALGTLVELHSLTEDDIHGAIDQVHTETTKFPIFIGPEDGIDPVQHPACQINTSVQTCARSLSPAEWLLQSWVLDDFLEKHKYPMHCPFSWFCKRRHTLPEGV